MNVAVETPAGEVSGSAVVGITAWFGQLPAMSNEAKDDVTGEAVVVKVAPGTRRGDWLYEIPKQTEPVELTGDRIPMLVPERNGRSRLFIPVLRV